MRTKQLFKLIVGLQPPSKLKNRLLTLFGCQVDYSSIVGPVLIWKVRELVIGPGAVIKGFNVLRNLELCEFGANSVVGQWNWISAAPFLVAPSSNPNAGNFRLGYESSLTSRHYIDASGGVQIGEFSTIAGVRSTFMSHAIDVEANEMTTGSIIVESYSMVGSNVKLVMGASVPARSIVAMGSIVTPGLTETDRLYAGSPAVAKKVLNPAGYMVRQTGRVYAQGDPRTTPSPRRIGY